MSRPTAPWPDFAGNTIRDGARIRHPNGDTGTVLHLPDLGEGGEAWRVVYETGHMARLSLQIGDKGRAVVLEQDISEFELQMQARAWRTLWEKLASLDPQLRAETGVTGITSALTSLDRMLEEIPKLRAQRAAMPAIEAYRDTTFDTKAVWDEVRVRVDGIGITAVQVATVLDAVARVARKQERK